MTEEYEYQAENRAIEALDEQLTFLRERASPILRAILEILEADTHRDVGLILGMRKELEQVPNKITKVAAEMLPYQNPKKLAVSNNVKRTDKFVMFGDDRKMDADEWLRKYGGKPDKPQLKRLNHNISDHSPSFGANKVEFPE